ncbi:MAG: putative carboxymethylenebutenolidase [Actinomycetia bacterium]|nr:putative carboxymethylenebutenolidase [Actinomycetes bacterium]
MTDMTIDTPDGAMPATVAEPAGEPRGGVIVIQEAFGLTDHIKDVARRLADAGWLAVAPALFHRSGSPVFEYDGDMKELWPVFQALDAAGIDADLTATLGYLEGRGIPTARTGIVGFCMGGTVALHAATRFPLGAAVTFYGGGVVEGRFGLAAGVDLAPTLQAPWLGLYGDLDKGIPVEQVEALREAAVGAQVETEVVRYAEADHGFNCDARASFHAASAADAWTRTLAWFDRNLV